MDFKITKHSLLNPCPKYNQPTDGETLFHLRWDYKGWQRTIGHTTQREWFSTLMTQINRVVVEMIKHDIITDYTEITNITTSHIIELIILNEMSYYHIYNSELTNVTNQIRRTGSLSGRYSVYVDNYILDNKIFIGTEGNPKLGCIIIDNCD
jgi:hypothetical protein